MSFAKILKGGTHERDQRDSADGRNRRCRDSGIGNYRDPAQETTRSQRWEAQKQKEREELEAKYRDAPYLTKIFALHFGRPLVILSVLVALGVLVSAGMKLTRAYHEKQAGQESGEEEFQWSKLDRPLTEEEAPKVYEGVPHRRRRRGQDRRDRAGERGRHLDDLRLYGRL